MADYYPLVAKAVAGLEKNTGEGRRALYERARSALVAQLRGMSEPPLTEAEITRERLALEEAIRKVEAEAARRGRDTPRPEQGAAPRREGARDLDAPAVSPRPQAPPAPPRGDAPPPPPPAADRAPRPRTSSRTVTDEGLKGFRDVIAEAEGLGEATALGSKAAREVFAATSPQAKETPFDRVEPRVEPEGLRTPSRPAGEPRVAEPRVAEPRVAEPRAPESRVAPSAPAWPPAPEPRASQAAQGAPAWPPAPEAQQPERTVEPRVGAQRQGPMRAPSADDIGELPKRSRVGLIAAILTVLIILGLGAVLYWQKDRVAAMVGAVRTQTQQAPKDQTPSKPKINDRVGQPSEGGGTETPPPKTGDATPAPAAAVAQRVVLYEEDPAEPAGKRYVGSAIWRTEQVTPSPGAAPDLAVRADLEIPERRITMTFSLRRNTDQALPASHTIEITFNLPADFAFGGISNVPGILMKQAEQTRGAPLAGLAVKVTSGFFLIGLSAVEADQQRNMQLLKERPWFDIPIVYNNGRRAILALEKGTPGEKAFEEAFKAWGQ
jgi:hypothetical protein